MATANEVAEVRENTNEKEEGASDFGNDIISSLIDSGGVLRASATIWRRKAGSYAELVNVSEAGATHSFSDLQQHALQMAEMYEGMAGEAEGTDATKAGRARVKVIDRAYGS